MTRIPADGTHNYQARVWTTLSVVDPDANCTSTTVQAHSLSHARKILMAEYGDHVAMSIWVEDYRD